MGEVSVSNLRCVRWPFFRVKTGAESKMRTSRQIHYVSSMGTKIGWRKATSTSDLIKYFDVRKQSRQGWKIKSDQSEGPKFKWKEEIFLPLSLFLSFSSFAMKEEYDWGTMGYKFFSQLVQWLTTISNAQNVTGCFAASPSWFVNNRKLALLSTVDQLHVKINAKNLEGNSSRPRVALI